MTRFFATLKKEKLYQYENTFGVDAVENLPDSLKIFRKRISTTFGKCAICNKICTN
mgnify:FL=1